MANSPGLRKQAKMILSPMAYIFGGQRWIFLVAGVMMASCFFSFSQKSIELSDPSLLASSLPTIVSERYILLDFNISFQTTSLLI